MTYQHAVIVGAGMAGLATARVLANHFRKVTVLDADRLPSDVAVRKRVPQGDHVHTLLPGGLEVLTRLFPELEKTLDAQGGLAAQPHQWYALTTFGKTYRVARFQPTPLSAASQFPGIRMQTRPLLEHCLRQCVAATARIELRDGTKVTAPLTEGDQIIGVRIDGENASIEADLVVDAGGRAGLTLAWLDRLGLERPGISEIRCDIAYASALFEPSDPDIFEDLGFIISSARDGAYKKRGGSLIRVEDNQWLVTLIGRLGDYPPTDRQGFLDYVATLHSNTLHNLLKTASFVNAPKRYGFPKSIRHHFERLQRFPAGLLPIGDTICQLNPGYGQGMSVAFRQAMALDDLLTRWRQAKRAPSSLWKAFCTEAFEQTRAAWLFAALIDFAKEGTTGDFPHEEQAAIDRIKQLNKLANKGDADAAHMVDSLFDIRRPLSSLQTADAD